MTKKDIFMVYKNCLWVIFLKSISTFRKLTDKNNYKRYRKKSKLGEVVMGRAMQIVHVQGKVDWKACRGKGGNWVAICDPLKLTIQADTWAEMMEDIGFTLNAVLNDLLASNELDRFMREHGWRVKDDR